MAIVFTGRWDENPSPALCQALHELATKAVAQLEANLEVAKEPVQHGEGANEYADNSSADSEPSSHITKS